MKEGDGIMSFKISNLKCEYTKNPLGLDIKRPRFSWTLDHSERNQKQLAYQIIVSSNLEKALREEGDVWDSGKVVSDNNVNVEYAGKELEGFQRYYWRVRCWDKMERVSPYSEVAFFEMGPLKSSDWFAKWIRKLSYKTFLSEGDHLYGEYEEVYAAYFRKEFEVKKHVKRARVYVCGLGLYELRMNGRKVGNNVLDPGQTDYSKIALYSTFDITGLVEEKNAIGVILGNGRHIKAYGYDHPKLILQILIEYEDGEREFIVTDESWKVSHGPLMENGIFHGELYDARLEMPGWDEPDFDDSDWESPVVTEGPKLRAQLMPPIRVTATLKPVRMWSPKPGIYVYDFGQNFTGWIRLYVKGPRGTEVKIRYAEILNDDGTINTSNLLKARALDTYILRGEGIEVYEPRFTYHGFKYVEITGYPGVPSLESVEGCFVHTDVKKVGDFYCSNEMINKIHRNAVWGQLCNLMSIPTDCPQRSERMGWMGDAQLSAEEAIHNFDMAQFYMKYLMDMKLSQKEDGSLSDVVPPYWSFYPADPAWGTAYITIAWYMYIYYNDTRVLEEHYENMVRYVEFLRRNSRDGIIENLGKYGDWCPPGSIFSKRTPVEFTATWYYYHDVLILSEIAKVLGRDEDHRKYRELADSIKESFNERFLRKKYVEQVKSDVYFYEGTKLSPIDSTPTSQTCNTLPLYLKMAPDDILAKVFGILVRLVETEHDFHLDTGIVGTRYIFDVLTEYGRPDLAYRVITRKSYPGFGYMIKEGATTLWERWEKLEGSGMNSHNHIMFGSVDTWFYKALGGVTVLDPGWGRFRVKPFVPDDMKFVKVRLDTVRGEISVSWEKDEGHFRISVHVPCNTTAEIYIPIFGKWYKIKEGGRKLIENGEVEVRSDVSFVKIENDHAVFNVGSGWYDFVEEYEPS